MNYEVAKECTMLSDEEKIIFPDVVSRLNKADIDLYYADLLVPNKTYYAKNEAYAVPCSSKVEKKVSDVFNKDKVVQAIQLIQAGQIKYQEFIQQIMEAGVISYLVFIKGRKAIYFGKRVEQHIEEFPS